MDALKLWASRLRVWNVEILGVEKAVPRHIIEEDEGFQDFDHLLQSPKDQASTNHSPLHFMVLGDMNLELEKSDPNPSHQWKKLAPRNLITSILAALKIKFLPLTLISTPPPVTRGMAILDYICLPILWNLNVHSMSILNSIPSDHAMVLAIISMETSYPKPPYWRFKNQLLDYPPYVKSMSILLKDITVDWPADPYSFLDWWENLKILVMLESKRCWSRLINSERKMEPEHQGYPIPFGLGDVGNSHQYTSLPSMIKFIKDKQGDIISDPIKVSQALTDFYSSIYSGSVAVPPPDDMTFGMPIVTFDDCEKEDQMSTFFTVEELHNAATQMNLGKAPGVDGITIEFYLKFWSFFGPLILQWFMHTLTIGGLSGSAGLGVISLVRKQGDPRLLSNWRPISLLTVDLKIVLKAINIRILPLISSTISQHQSALPGSTIFNSLSLIRDIISLQNISKKTLWILSLDLQRAFDNVSHAFLFHLLEVIKLPPFLIKAIKTTYSNFSCVVKNRSTLSSPFPYLRGIRQGDPTSTILFALVCQPLVNAFNIVMPHEGFMLPDGDNILLTNYADDFTLFLQDFRSVSLVVEIFKKVAYYSGAVINLEKSSIMGLNVPPLVKEQVTSSVSSIPISYDFIKILGIVFTYSLKIYQEQWMSKIISTRIFIESRWKHLVNLTVYGRAHWMKTRLWPRWSHLFKVLQPSISQIKQLSDLFSEVVWLAGKHWLSVDKIAMPVSNGGLDSIIVTEKIEIFRIMMIAKLCVMEPTSYCFKLATIILKNYANLGFGLDLFHSSPEKNELSTLPSVYAAAFVAWNRLPVCFQPLSRNDIMDLPVIASKFLSQAEIPIFVTSALARSMKIKYIVDLYNFTPTVTRLSNHLVRSVIDDVDKWVFPPWPDGDEHQVMENNKTINNSPRFFVQSDNSLIPVERWSNSFLTRVVKSLRLPIKELAIPYKTWRILKTVFAPALFVNHTWRFYHNCTVTPTFFFHMGLRDGVSCFLCASPRCDLNHQFRSCIVLQLAIQQLNCFISLLGLPPLLNQAQLYPDPSSDHNLANFLILAFYYTVVLVSRNFARSDLQTPINARKLRTLFRAVISKHLQIYALSYSPVVTKLRHKWDLYTHKAVIAYFEKDDLFILSQNAFMKYDCSPYKMTSV